MRQDNRGVSLVEILIVVSIITVLAGVGIYGVSLMSGQPAKKCSQKIVYSLERHRTTAMSKVNAKYVLSTDGDKIYFQEFVIDGADASGTWVDKPKVEIGSSGVEVKYVLDGGSETPLTTGNSLTLEFDRASGAFKPQAGGYCTQIIVSRGGKEFKITLVPLTGKVYID